MVWVGSDIHPKPPNRPRCKASDEFQFKHVLESTWLKPSKNAWKVSNRCPPWHFEARTNHYSDVSAKISKPQHVQPDNPLGVVPNLRSSLSAESGEKQTSFRFRENWMFDKQESWLVAKDTNFHFRDVVVLVFWIFWKFWRVSVPPKNTCKKQRVSFLWWLFRGDIRRAPKRSETSWSCNITPPKINIATQKWWLEEYFPFGFPQGRICNGFVYLPSWLALVGIKVFFLNHPFWLAHIFSEMNGSTTN